MITLTSSILAVAFDASGPTHVTMLSKPALPILAGGIALSGVFGWRGMFTGSVKQLNSNSVRVSHVYTSSLNAGFGTLNPFQINAEYTYTLSGRELRVHIVATNPGATPQPLFLNLPTFTFSRVPSGNMASFDASYIAANPGNALHPGSGSPFAASWMFDHNIGVCVHAPSHFEKQTVFSVVNPSASPAPVFWTGETIQPGGTVTLDLCLHISIHTDKPTMLESYIKDFQKRGPQRYASDHRPIVQWEGDQGDGLGINSPEAVALEQSRLTPLLGVIQGMIFWQPQGFQRTHATPGLKYLPDFATWPADVQANLPTLFAWMESKGLRHGLLARPGATMTDPFNFKPTDPNSPADMAALKAQFDAMAVAGVNGYYLDSIGDTLDGYRILNVIRDWIGPNVLTLAEFGSDIALQHTGRYFEQHSSGAPEIDVETIRLLYPNAVIACMARNVVLPPEWFLRWRVTPIVSSWQPGITVPLCQAVTVGMKGTGWK